MENTNLFFEKGGNSSGLFFLIKENVYAFWLGHESARAQWFIAMICTHAMPPMIYDFDAEIELQRNDLSYFVFL